MMKTSIKISILFVLSVLSTVSLSAQVKSCGHDHKHDSLIAHDPRFSRSLWQLEMAVEKHMAIPEAERSETVYTLPVVVHIIHEGEPIGTGSNISDAQVFSAITALNNDFRRVAGTVGFGDGVDIGIEFCLASRNPQGQPTNGIVRVNGSSVPLYAEQGIESTGSAGASEEAVKALSTWPRSSYVNIWIVNEIENNDGGSGVQGYAYFPFNNPVDGIVVLFNAFGTVGNLKSYTDMNRTLTHEMGHYLGLYHTFHTTTSCNQEIDCTVSGDRVCDTPVTVSQTFCTTPACSGTQQVENYLDYTPESCQNMFTPGQKTRMRATLETQRTSMTTSMGCMPVFTRDAGITAVLNPNNTTSCNTSYTPQVTLANFGSVALTTVTINYNANGQGNSTFSWTGNLAPGASTNVTLPAFTVGLGVHTFYAWTTSPNGQSDENNNNNQSTSTFTVTTGTGLTLTVQVDFFGAETTWEIVNAQGVVMDSGGPYQNNVQGTIYTEPLCLPNGCYDLIFHDSYGDGMGFTNGQFNLYNANNVVLVNETGNWGDVSVNEFCVTGAPEGSAPTAMFGANDNQICMGSGVNFTYTGTGNPNSYNWIFEGASTATSSSSNPSNIVYQNTGTFDVTLTVTNQYGSNTYNCNNCITVVAAPTITTNAIAPTCFGGSNGSISTTLSGGNAPFNYTWSNGGTTSSIGNLSAGNYNITVTDAQGCIRTATANITSPTAMSITGTILAPSCSGASNGSIVVSVTGGTGNKTYMWNNGSTTPTVTGLTAGTYVVAVTDANGCSANQSFVVSQPAPLQVSVFTSEVSCFGLSDGNAVASATGGTGNVSYSWNTGATQNFLANLSQGTYIVTATDANGCTDTESVLINQPDMLVANVIVVSEETCAGNDGSAIVEAQGGNGDYYIVWSNGTESATIENVSAGEYLVSIADQLGCYINTSIVIPYDCQAGVPQTKLVATDCGASGLGLNSIVSCEPVENAAMYQWKFTTGTGVLISEDFTIDNQFLLSQSNAIELNMNMLVTVKALVENNWGAYGEACSIQMQVDLSPTALSESSCSASLVNWNSSIEANEIPGAISYEWTFSSSTGEIIVQTNQPTLELVQSLDLQENIAYEVSVRAFLMNGMWTEDGVSCTVTIQMIVGVDEEDADNSVIVYPNPGDGRFIRLSFDAIQGEVSKNISVYSLSGSLVETISVANTDKADVEHNFTQPLSTGMYVLRYTINNSPQEEKFIVK